jgi:uncharacterized membrane protein
MDYAFIKFLHVMSAVVMLGMGAGLAFFLFRAQRNGDPKTLLFALDNVVLGDCLFTAPSILVLLGTGHFMLRNGPHSVREPWMIASLALLMLAGLCWLAGVYVQWRMRSGVRESVQQGGVLPLKHAVYSRVWLALGVIAFPAAVAILILMVVKPALAG